MMVRRDQEVLENSQKEMTKMKSARVMTYRFKIRTEPAQMKKVRQLGTKRDQTLAALQISSDQI